MTIYKKDRVSKGFPLSRINTAIAMYLKDVTNIFQVIEIIGKSNVEGQHLKSILHLWYGFGNSKNWDKLFKQCQEEGLFINRPD